MIDCVIGRLGQPVDQIKGIGNFAVQVRVPGAPQRSHGPDGFGFVEVGSVFLLGLGHELFLVFQRFVDTVASKIIEYLEGKTKRVHALVTFPAFGLFRNRLHAFAQRFMRILRYFSVHSDGHAGTLPARSFPESSVRA